MNNERRTNAISLAMVDTIELVAAVEELVPAQLAAIRITMTSELYEGTIYTVDIRTLVQRGGDLETTEASQKRF